MKPLGKSSHRLDGNIKMDLKENGWLDVNWIQLALGRLQSRLL
jgi:hypothetical protein